MPAKRKRSCDFRFRFRLLLSPHPRLARLVNPSYSGSYLITFHRSVTPPPYVKASHSTSSSSLPHPSFPANPFQLHHSLPRPLLSPLALLLPVTPGRPTPPQTLHGPSLPPLRCVTGCLWAAGTISRQQHGRRCIRHGAYGE